MEGVLNLTLEGEVTAPTHIETWQGLLVAGEKQYDLQFRIFSDDANNLTVKHDSIGENVGGISAEITSEAGSLAFKIPATSAEFTGVKSADGNVVEGTWKQGGGEYPMTISKVAIEETRDWQIKRPQTPQPPFDYSTRDLVLSGGAADVTLAGTLTAPNGAGPFPLVILISGSGPRDRDETIEGHKPFLVIADYLATGGIACFRYDDRGVGGSTGDFNSATTADLANDAGAVVEFLRTQPLVDPARICLMGHSEGGVIAPIVASSREDIAAIVLLAGTGVDGRQISLNQSELLMRAEGYSEGKIEVNSLLLTRMYDHQHAGGKFDDPFIIALTDEVTDFMLKNEIEGSVDEVAKTIKQAAMQVESPWFKFFVTLNPAVALSRTRCPVYAVVGSRDLQVDPNLNLPAIEAALNAAGNKQFKIEVFPGLNHLFQTCESGSVSEYRTIEETFSPTALDKITAWVKQTLR